MKILEDYNEEKEYVNKEMTKNKGFTNLDLENCTSENTPWFSFEGTTKKCKCVDVYDADTVTLVVNIEGKYYKKKCRLLGIDGAEKRTKNLSEKEHAKKGQKRVADLIENKIVWVECGDWDKYGRLLGKIYLTPEDVGTDNSINNILIKEKLAYSYDGKKKQKFEEWYKV